jgi:4-hydroxy-tetrahydrodipicolinate synthase
VHFVVPCGTTGETPTLSRDERDLVVRTAVDVCRGKISVLAGVGGYDTMEVAEIAAHTETLGVQGILSVTPYYNKPTQEGLYQHYKAIAESTSLPIVVYNVPGRTGCNVDPATLARIATLTNIVGVKEASGNMSQMAEVCHRLPPEFNVLSGDDLLTLPLMAVGGRGIISVVSNEAPAEMVQLVEAAERGDFAAARQWHDKLVPLMNINFIESSPGPVKYAMAAMGLCEETFRLPMVPPRRESQEKILAALRTFGLPVVTELHA